MPEEDVVPTHARLVRDFVNTYERQVDEESLTTARDLGDWLAQRVPDAAEVALTRDDLDVALAIREGLRAVLLGHAGHDTDPAALRALDAALQQVPVRLTVTPDGQRLLPADSSALAQALAPLVDAVRRCGEDQTWRRLKACSRDTCRWAYYDSSRNQSRRWCSMAGCGNYIKMRRRAAAAPSAR
jgi:predicted RNA-binding Zn ribbon-like protein